MIFLVSVQFNAKTQFCFKLIMINTVELPIYLSDHCLFKMCTNLDNKVQITICNTIWNESLQLLLLLFSVNVFLVVTGKYC